jgi:DNA-binding CsgD family transcriptional regulator
MRHRSAEMRNGRPRTDVAVANGEAEMCRTVAWLSEAAEAFYAALSPRERAVLLAAALGAEDKEIAAELGCTLSTVRTHWQRTYRKTHLPSRRQLVAMLWAEACHLASCHFLNDMTAPRESARVAGGQALRVRASAGQPYKG